MGLSGWYRGESEERREKRGGGRERRSSAPGIPRLTWPSGGRDSLYPSKAMLVKPPRVTDSRAGISWGPAGEARLRGASSS